MIAGMILQKLQECKVTKFVSLQVHIHSDGHMHDKQQQRTQVSVLETMGKHFLKASSHNLAAELPSEHMRCICKL